MVEASSGPPASVDHVWGNTRAFLPGGRLGAACQLGGDRLGPQLAELAAMAVVVGPGVRPGKGWAAVAARPDRAPFPDGTFDLVAVEHPAGTGQPPGPVLREARRLCRPTGSPSPTASPVGRLGTPTSARRPAGSPWRHRPAWPSGARPPESRWCPGRR